MIIKILLNCQIVESSGTRARKSLLLTNPHRTHRKPILLCSSDFSALAALQYLKILLNLVEMLDLGLTKIKHSFS